MADQLHEGAAYPAGLRLLLFGAELLSNVILAISP
jgi:hypothetical protein